MRRSTDRLYPTTAGPREREAERLIAEKPGITIGELRDTLGVGKARIWQIVARLERGRVRANRRGTTDHDREPAGGDGAAP